MIRKAVSGAELAALKQRYDALEFEGYIDELSKLPEMSDSGGRTYLIFKDEKHMQDWYCCGS